MPVSGLTVVAANNAAIPNTAKAAELIVKSGKPRRSSCPEISPINAPIISRGAKDTAEHAEQNGGRQSGQQADNAGAPQVGHASLAQQHLAHILAFEDQALMGGISHRTFLIMPDTSLQGEHGRTEPRAWL